MHNNLTLKVSIADLNVESFYLLLWQIKICELMKATILTKDVLIRQRKPGKGRFKHPHVLKNNFPCAECGFD